MQLTDRAWTRRLVVMVILGGIIGAGLGLSASALTVPGYDASAFLLVTPAGDTPLETSQVQYAQAISQVITNPTVLAAAGDSEVPDDPEQIRADPSSNAPMIEIIVNAETAGQAQRQAQATAEAVVAYTGIRADLLGFQAVVLAPAATGTPAGLSLVAYLVAGTAMGAVLGGVLALYGGALVAALRRLARGGDTGAVRAFGVAMVGAVTVDLISWLSDDGSGSLAVLSAVVLGGLLWYAAGLNIEAHA